MAENNMDDFTIYILNTNYVIYPVMKDCFELSDTDIYNTIAEGFKVLKNRLASKGILYDDLKGALLPNQEKDKFETCFIFDSSQIEEGDYGSVVFSKILPQLDKNSTYSILCGDYIDILDNVEDSQMLLRSSMNDVISRCNKSKFQHSSQYYLVYFNRLTGTQRWCIVEELMKYSWFTGFADVTHQSLFKTYLSFILTHSFIKYRGQIILAHPSDCTDDENLNMRGYSFQEIGYPFISINEDSFGPFLSYKIEPSVPNETDVSFSFNALFPKFDSITKLKMKISDEKWNNYLLDEDKKGKIVKALGYDIPDKDKFIQDIYNKICSSYIYKLERKKHGDTYVWKFCVCIDVPTTKGHYRKTTIVLKYFPDSGEIFIITLT